MKTAASGWNDFLETGKIDDYLKYCYQRKQEMYSFHDDGGAVDDIANDNSGDCSSALQNRAR